MGEAADYVYDGGWWDDYDYDGGTCYGEFIRLNINENRRRYFCKNCYAILSRKRSHSIGKNWTRVRVDQCYPEYRDLILLHYQNAEITIISEKELAQYLDHLKNFRKRWRDGLTEEYRNKVEKALNWEKDQI